MALALSCASNPTATVVEIPPPPETAAPPPPAVQKPPSVAVRPAPPDCARPPQTTGCVTIARVVASDFELSSPSCYVDSIIRTGAVGRLQQCAGGSAVIVFDKGVFAASFDGTNVDACTSSRFPFSDGCTWQSLQRIEGPLRDKLVFTYSETHVEGKSCASSSCRAHATLTVLP